MKAVRQQKILEIIASHTVSTQEELQELLQKEGFCATQATISRDIRELRLVKNMTPAGGYCYNTPQEQQPAQIPISLGTVFVESIKSVDYAGNFTVIKCFSGMANAVCVNIDTGRWEGLVGTLAGDDTIFLLMRTEEQAKEFCRFIQETIRKTK